MRTIRHILIATLFVVAAGGSWFSISPPAHATLTNVVTTQSDYPTSLQDYAPSHLAYRSLNADSTKLQISWQPPRLIFVGMPVTAYQLNLNNVTIATYRIQNGKLPTSYPIAATLLRNGGKLSVVAIEGIAHQTAASPSITIPANPTAMPVTPKSPTPTPTTGSVSGGLGGAVANPPYQDANPNDALETYGSGRGIFQVYSENGKFDINQALYNSFTGDILVVISLLSIGSYAILGWSLIKAVFGTYIATLISLANSYINSQLEQDVIGICCIGVLLVGISALLRDQDRVKKIVGSACLVIGAVILLNGNVATVIPEISEAPLTAAQVTMVSLNGWHIPHETAEGFNLSVRPTYNGDELQQGVRKYLNQSWLSNVYPVFCQVNYGNLNWSTTTYVPDDPALPTYHHLTFCEYLLKAETENNQAAISKLVSHDHYLGLEHQKGYVETASPSEWTFLQGNDKGDVALRYIYAIAGLGSVLLDALTKTVIGLLVLAFRFLLGWDGLLLFLIVAVAMIPDARSFLWDHLVSMGRRTVFPSVVLAAVMIIDRISYSVISVETGFGWLLTMFLRDLLVIGLLTYTMFKLYKRWRRASDRRKMMKEQRQSVDDLPDRYFGSTPSLVQTPVQSQLPSHTQPLPALPFAASPISPAALPSSQPHPTVLQALGTSVDGGSASTLKAIMPGGASTQMPVYDISSMALTGLSKD